MIFFRVTTLIDCVDFIWFLYSVEVLDRSHGIHFILLEVKVNILSCFKRYFLFFALPVIQLSPK
jgi:hypothetical protein